MRTKKIYQEYVATHTTDVEKDVRFNGFTDAAEFVKKNRAEYDAIIYIDSVTTIVNGLFK